ncbi:hypothetical protein PAHAL_4G288900 [Panicum hallii]|uniref:Uncharacterized protein n=1 Tax=Panicum hallii TaxID=206008 RepID=A0A2T8JEC0_9POAL|nr:hypothetical protein PAHAL_4G288900 [Panicum hallii]
MGRRSSRAAALAGPLGHGHGCQHRRSPDAVSRIVCNGGVHCRMADRAATDRNCNQDRVDRDTGLIWDGKTAPVSTAHEGTLCLLRPDFRHRHGFGGRQGRR